MKSDECGLLDVDAIEIDIDSNLQQIKPESTVSKTLAKTSKLVTNFSDFLRVPDMQLFDKMKAHQREEECTESHNRAKIQRVQNVSRRNDDFKHYEPLEISFGIFHANEPELFKEELKLKMAARFTKGTEENMFGEIKNNLPELKKCFHENDIQYFNDEELARLLFLDGCAILQFIDSYTNQTLNDFNIHNSQSELIKQDLFLLENQIPFQVLQLLIDVKEKNRAPERKESDNMKGKNRAPEREKSDSMKDKNRASEREESDSMKYHLIKFLLQNNIIENVESRTIPSKQISDLISSKENQPVHLLDLLRSVLVFDTHVKKEHTPTDPEIDDVETSLSAYFVWYGDIFTFPEIDEKLRRYKYCIYSGYLIFIVLAIPFAVAFTVPFIVLAIAVIVLGIAYIVLATAISVLVLPFLLAYFLFASSNAKYYWNQQHSFRNVQDLKASGISMKASNSCSLKKISFRAGCLFRGYVNLPPLLVDGSTERKMLNLVAYEMSNTNYQKECYVMSYINLLDLLIDNEDDVKDLRSMDVLRNHLSNDKEVSVLIDRIGKTCFAPPQEKFVEVKEKIENHYKRKVAVWMAQVYHAHFSSPWTVLALLATVTILVLTAIQAWYAIKSNK